MTLEHAKHKGGTDGYRNTGGGSGGSIFLNASSMTLAAASVRVNGGAGQNMNCFNNNCSVSNSATKGGDGGFGRIRLAYGSLNGTNFPNGGAEAVPAIWQDRVCEIDVTGCQRVVTLAVARTVPLSARISQEPVDSGVNTVPDSVAT